MLRQITAVKSAHPYDEPPISEERSVALDCDTDALPPIDQNTLSGGPTERAIQAGPQGLRSGSEERAALPAARLDVHSQMWRDGLPFGSIVQTLQAWVNSEAHISAVAIDYSWGYRVGILADRLTRDIMRALHDSFEQVRPRFGDHQPAVYVLGNKEKDADIFIDDTSHVIRRSK